MNAVMPIRGRTILEIDSQRISFEVGEFEKLSLLGNMKVNLYPCEGPAHITLSCSCPSRAEINLLSARTVCVRQCEDPCCSEPIELVVCAPNITEIETCGSISLSSAEALRCHRFFLQSQGSIVGGINLSVGTFVGELHGAGNLSVWGAAKDVLLEVRGKIRLDTRKLISDVVDAQVRGPCRLALFASQQAIVSASDFACLQLFGHPHDYRKCSHLAWIRRV